MFDKEFIDSLKELLIKEHCVVVPNFGAFLLRDNGSTMNIYTKEIKPIQSTVHFNRDVKTDDGLLTNYIKDKHNIGFREASIYVQNCVLEIKNAVETKKICNLTPLGNFFKNAESELFFIGNNNFNLNVHSFGLKPIKWTTSLASTEKQMSFSQSIQPETEDTLEDAIVIDISSEEHEQTTIRHRNNKFWNVAANIALVTFSLGILYMNGVFIHSALQKKENELASNIPTSPKITEKQEFEQSSVMVVNGEIVQLDEHNKVMVPTNEKSEIPSIEDYKSIIAAGKGKYFIVGGSYITEDAAKIECRQWNQLNQNATYIKVKGSTLLKVVIKRFESGKDASAFVETLTKLPNNTISIQELIITK